METLVARRASSPSTEPDRKVGWNAQHKKYVVMMMLHPPGGDNPKWVAISKCLPVPDAEADTEEAAVLAMKENMRAFINGFVTRVDPKTKRPAPEAVPWSDISTNLKPGSRVATFYLDAEPPRK